MAATGQDERIPERSGTASGQRKARRDRRWEPADTVVALSTGLLVIIFAIFALLIWRGVDATIEQARQRALTGAEVVADEAGWVIGSSLALLTDLAADVDGDPRRIDQARAEQFRAAALQLPATVELAVYDASGAAIPGDVPDGVPTSISALDYFTPLANGTDWMVSAQPRTAAENHPSFVVAKRLQSADGSFRGVAVAVLGEQVLESFWARQNLGPDSTVSLMRADGTVVARFPPLKEALNLSSLPIYKTLTGSESGSYASPRSPVDGVARIVGFRQVPDLGFTGLAAVSQDAVMAALWTAVWTVLYLMGPIALALLLGSLLTARLLRQGERTRRNLAAAVAHNEVLFREIHHRVKNNLQSVAALLQLQPIPREIKQEMSLRINAMSAVHEHIYRSNNFATVHVRDYLQILIENIRAGHDPAVKVVESIENLPVDRDNATPLGLILNEVVSNAFKHAFVDGREAVVTVRLVREDEDSGRLQVEDNGVGFDPDKPAKGIGRRLIAALTEQLGGTSSFSSGATGARFTLVFPLAKPAQDGAQ